MQQDVVLSWFQCVNTVQYSIFLTISLYSTYVSLWMLHTCRVIFNVLKIMSRFKRAIKAYTGCYASRMFLNAESIFRFHYLHKSYFVTRGRNLWNILIALFLKLYHILQRYYRGRLCSFGYVYIKAFAVRYHYRSRK